MDTSELMETLNFLLGLLTGAVLGSSVTIIVLKFAEVCF